MTALENRLAKLEQSSGAIGKVHCFTVHNAAEEAEARKAMAALPKADFAFLTIYEPKPVRP